MRDRPMPEFVARVRELATAYLETHGPLAACDDPLTHPADPALRRLLQRIGFLRGQGATAVNRRRLAALRQACSKEGADLPAFLDRLQGYCAAEGCCSETPDCARCDLQTACAHYQRRPTIKDLPQAQRPRERLFAGGPDSLSDAELLAIIIRDGTQNMSALDLAEQLLAEYRSLENLARPSAQELAANRKLRGLGPAKAAQVCAAMALARRYETRPFDLGESFTRSRQIYEHYAPRLGTLEQEVFLTLLLDTKNRLIREIETSRGGQNSSPVDMRLVFSGAVRAAASAVICVHNHPSGDACPSRDDTALTTRLREAGEILGLRILDHIIIGRGSYYSFADEGRL